MIVHKLPRHDIKRINFADKKNMPYFSFIAKGSILIEKGRCVRATGCTRVAQKLEGHACNVWTPNYAVISSFTAERAWLC